MRLRLGLTAGGLLVLALSILSLTQTSSSPARQSSHKITSQPRVTPSDTTARTPRRSQAKPRADRRQSRTPIAPATVMTSPSQAAVPVSPSGGSAAKVSVARMVGQQLMVRMTGLTPDSHLLARIHAGQVGGIILYGDDIESAPQLSALVAELQAAAHAGGNPPLLISTDQEGGEVKRLPWAAPTIAPPQMTGPVVSEAQGRDTGIALHAAGINVDLAPVADVAHSTSAFIWQQQRSFGRDPGTVTASTLAFARGLESAGVAPTAKHFPGLGAALTDTDFELQRLQLTPKDLAPYRALIPAHIPLIMVSTAFYTNLDPSSPAALSKIVISGMLRHDMGYGGVVMTDDLERPTGQSPAQAAVRADQAGADIILVSTTEGGGVTAYDALLSAADNGQISHDRIAEAHQRILALKARYAPS